MPCAEYHPVENMRCECGAMSWEHQQFRRTRLPVAVGDGDPSLRPIATLPDLERMSLALRGRGWVRARTLTNETKFNERSLRELASQSDGMILGGQKGYRLTEETDTQQVEATAAWLEAQAAKMARRAQAIRRVLALRDGPQQEGFPQ